MLGGALLDLLPEGARRSGSLLFRGRDLAALSDREWSGVPARPIALVFQEPAAALDPVRTVVSQIAEALRRAGSVDRSAIRRRARELLEGVAFADPATGLSGDEDRL